MSKYALRVIKLGETWCLPLPKLNKSQMGLLGQRLEKKGYVVEQSRLLVASKEHIQSGWIHRGSVGLGWTRVMR